MPFLGLPETRRRRERALAISLSIEKQKRDVAWEHMSDPIIGRHQALVGVNHTRNRATPSSLSIAVSSSLPQLLAPGPCSPTMFRMEHSICNHRSLYSGNSFPSLPTHSLSSTLPCLLLVSSIVTPGMGRHSWAMPDQLIYLKRFVHLLDQAKETTGLTMLYPQVYDGFTKKWPPDPLTANPDDRPASTTPDTLAARGKKKL